LHLLSIPTPLKRLLTGIRSRFDTSQGDPTPPHHRPALHGPSLQSLTVPPLPPRAPRSVAASVAEPCRSFPWRPCRPSITFRTASLTPHLFFPPTKVPLPFFPKIHAARQSLLLEGHCTLWRHTGPLLVFFNLACSFRIFYARSFQFPTLCNAFLLVIRAGPLSNHDSPLHRAFPSFPAPCPLCVVLLGAL